MRTVARTVRSEEGTNNLGCKKHCDRWYHQNSTIVTLKWPRCQNTLSTKQKKCCRRYSTSLRNRKRMRDFVGTKFTYIFRSNDIPSSIKYRLLDLLLMISQTRTVLLKFKASSIIKRHYFAAVIWCLTLKRLRITFYPRVPRGSWLTAAIITHWRNLRSFFVNLKAFDSL